MDRFNNNQFMLNIIDSDIDLISKLSIGIILVGSISLNYSNYQDILKQKFSNNICYQPYFSVINDANAYEFFDNVLKKRSPEKFISDAARKILITYSGGVLRDLINLTQNSIEEAYLNDSDTIQKSHVNAAVEAYGQTKIFGVSNSELQILAKVAKGETFLPRTREYSHLLINQMILEYTYPKKRYAVHPVLLPLISQPLA
ncbi:hypothetical protein CY0110_18622 [Crocosphaera chwakensis CCY0110]|uniref:Uncharacterized protein n=1 Tax=Crocosphaera chwakensis CCY0110 TaxID=391612 RepID=A3IJ56_9CHRO|nr:hypothetical protein CY0110_18622 [Crocosphaera chwakensis CCY0110]